MSELDAATFRAIEMRRIDRSRGQPSAPLHRTQGCHQRRVPATLIFVLAPRLGPPAILRRASSPRAGGEKLIPSGPPRVRRQDTLVSYRWLRLRKITYVQAVTVVSAVGIEPTTL
jgi:hypothetical protein